MQEALNVQDLHATGGRKNQVMEVACSIPDPAFFDCLLKEDPLDCTIKW